MSQVGISIVNYKTADLAIDCLKSLYDERALIDFQVILVDNDSQDDSFEKIASAIQSQGWGAWVRIVAAEYNGGFSYGNNIAIRQFMSEGLPPEFIYLLNPDAYVTHNAVNQLVKFMQEHAEVGIVGSRIEYPDGSPQNSAFKFHSFITELNRGFSLGILAKLLKPWLSAQLMPVKAEKTDWVSGASMLIRGSVFKQTGLLDEAYFMYFEETDFCLQAKRSGWECWYVPESCVIHHAGQSTGISGGKIQDKRRPKYWFTSRHRFFLKNYSFLHALVADTFYMLGLSIFLLRNLVQKKACNYPPCFLYDTFMSSVFVKGIRISPIKNK